MGPGFGGGLVSILRLGLLAFTFAGALNILVAFFHGAAVGRSAGAPAGLTYLALGMATASAALMVALAVNAAFLVDRLFSRRVAGYLFVAVFALGAGAIAAGLLGSTSMGVGAAVFLLVPALPFVLIMLMARGPLGRPAPSVRAGGRGPAAPRSSARPAPQRPRQAPQRQRRGGRKR
jgi:hypothetical protein